MQLLQASTIHLMTYILELPYSYKFSQALNLAILAILVSKFNFFIHRQYMLAKVNCYPLSFTLLDVAIYSFWRFC
jgi:hypothetical protein